MISAGIGSGLIIVRKCEIADLNFLDEIIYH